MVSQVLGERYEVQQQLGKKAGRRTLLVRDLKTQELAILKLLTFDTTREYEDLKLFKREAETLKTLNHPLIPRYLNYFELDSQTTNKRFALVQTYIEGESLEEQLKAGRTFSEADVKQIGKALLKILIYVHGCLPGVIHRNIKPSNILLTNRSGNRVGEVYLIDFGCVQTRTGREGGTRNQELTYGYIPLEQLGGRTVPASDLYSLGATLIYLLTGKHPVDLSHKEGRIQFEQMVNLSPDFASWLRQMTQPSLDLRLTSAQKALQALEEPPARKATSLEEPSVRKAASPVLRKPPGSKVLLTKDAKSLEILIPPPKPKPSDVFLLVFAIAWIASTAFSTVSSVFVAFPLNLIFVLLSLPILVVGFSLAYKVLFTLIGCIRLRLTQEEISLTHELFRFKSHHPRPSPRRDINELAHIPKHSATDSNGEMIEVPPQLIVWAGEQKYELSGTAGLITAELEMEWLAQELSNWLGLPISKR